MYIHIPKIYLDSRLFPEQEKGSRRANVETRGGTEGEGETPEIWRGEVERSSNSPPKILSMSLALFQKIDDKIPAVQRWLTVTSCMLQSPDACYHFNLLGTSPKCWHCRFLQTISTICVKCFMLHVYDLISL